MPRTPRRNAAGQFSSSLTPAKKRALSARLRAEYGEPPGSRRKNQNGLTVRDLAARHGVSKSWVSYVVNGER